MRRICAGVNVGNTCSVRELASGSPRLIWLIMVVGGAAALANYLSDFSLNITGGQEEIVAEIQVPFFPDLG